MGTTGIHTRSRTAALLTTLALTAGIVVAGPTGQAHAADTTTGATWQDLTEAVTVGVLHDGRWTTIDAGTMGLDTDGDGTFETPVYCIEPWTHVTNEVNEAGGYHSYDWGTYQATTPLWQQNRTKIASLLAHSYPNVSLSQMLTDAGLSSTAMPEPFAAATVQQAVWQLTSGLGGTNGSGYDWTGAYGTGYDTRYAASRYRLYDHLLTKAANADTAAVTGVGFSDVPTGVAGGFLGPVRLESTTDAAVDVLPAEGSSLPAGVRVTTADGTPVTGPVAAGTDFYVEIPADAPAGSALLGAQVTTPQTLAVGSVWDNPRITTQALVTARATTTRASAVTRFTWAAAPVEENPAPEETPTDTTPDTATPSASTAPSATATPPTIPSPRPSAPAPSTTVAPTPVPTPGPVTGIAPQPVAAPSPVTTTAPVATPTPIVAPTPVTAPREDPAPRRTPAPTPVHPGARLVTRTFQVDRYVPRTAAQARIVAALDDDRRLTHREDRALWGASTWEFVTVRVPANATTAQVVRAIAAATSARVGDVTTTRSVTTARVGRATTIAWELAPGARPTPAAAWGPRHTLAQTFVARS